MTVREGKTVFSFFIFGTCNARSFSCQSMFHTRSLFFVQMNERRGQQKKGKREHPLKKNTKKQHLPNHTGTHWLYHSL